MTSSIDPTASDSTPDILSVISCQITRSFHLQEITEKCEEIRVLVNQERFEIIIDKENKRKELDEKFEDQVARKRYECSVPYLEEQISLIKKRRRGIVFCNIKRFRIHQTFKEFCQPNKNIQELKKLLKNPKDRDKAIKFQLVALQAKKLQEYNQIDTKYTTALAEIETKYEEMRTEYESRKHQIEQQTLKEIQELYILIEGMLDCPKNSAKGNRFLFVMYRWLSYGN